MRLSYSSLKAFIESPNHYLLYKEEKVQTESMRKGTILDDYLFTDFSAYHIEDIDKRTKIGKERAKELEGKIIISTEEIAVAEKQKARICENPEAYELLRDGEYQKKLEGNIGGIDFVGYADIFKMWGVIDLKTAQSAKADEFSRAIYNLKYHLQAAIYTRLSNTDEFFWLVVENKPPYNCQVYKASTAMLRVGNELLDMAIEKFKIWDGTPQSYSTQTEIINLPPWAK